MPVSTATRCALFLCALAVVMVPLALFGMAWIAKALVLGDLSPRQAIPVAVVPVAVVPVSPVPVSPVPVSPVPVSVAPVADSRSVAVMREPHPPADLKSSLIGSQIAEMVASSQQQTADENLSELDTMSKKLNSVASEESVDDLSNKVQLWMGLESRATQSKSVSKIDEFEIDSAQLHDVQRKEPNPGRFEYTAVLIDARGSTIDIQLTEAEGRETYVLMQRIKANPLLEKIYRRIAMPLLDNLVQSARDQVKSPPPVRGPR